MGQHCTHSFGGRLEQCLGVQFRFLRSRSVWLVLLFESKGVRGVFGMVSSCVAFKRRSILVRHLAKHASGVSGNGCISPMG